MVRHRLRQRWARSCAHLGSILASPEGGLSILDLTNGCQTVSRSGMGDPQTARLIFSPPISLWALRSISYRLSPLDLGVKIRLGMPWRGGFIPVPQHELFANEERNVAAVNIALGPLVTKSTTAEAPEKKP